MNRWVYIAIIIVLICLNLWFRLPQRDLLYAPYVDSGLLTYWAQSVVNAKKFGFDIILSNPKDLISHPETKLYQLLAIVYDEAHRVFNLGSVLLLIFWLTIFGSNIFSAFVFSNFLGILLGMSVAKIASNLLESNYDDRYLLFIIVFVLIAFNPLVLMYSVSPSWHGITLSLLFLAFSFSGRSWRVFDWNLHKSLLIWLILLVTLYSTYLLPVIFIFSWSAVDILTMSKKTLKKSIFFWASLWAMYIPGVIFILLRPEAPMRWLNYWLTLKLEYAIIGAKNALFATYFLLPSIFLIKKDLALKTRPLLLYFLLVTVLFIFLMNRPSLGRIFLYLTPIIGLCAVLIWKFCWGRILLTMISIFLVVGNLTFAEALFKFLCPNKQLILRPMKAYAYKEVSDALRRLSFKNVTYFFECRDQAVQILSRINNAELEYISNIKKYVGAIDRGKLDAYLEFYYPKLKVHDKKILITRGNNKEIMC